MKITGTFFKKSSSNPTQTAVSVAELFKINLERTLYLVGKLLD
jgi:hypothetical protein